MSRVVGNVDARLDVPGVGGIVSEVPRVAASVELWIRVYSEEC